MPEMGTMQQINSEPLRTATVLTPQSQAEQYAREAQQAAAEAAQSATDAQTAAESAQQAVAGAVKYSEAQTLTADQQAQARANIGAASGDAPAAPAIIASAGPADIVSITDGAEDALVKSLVVNIKPVQAGSGDPSPDNVRPISGWSGVKIFRRNQNLWNPDFYSPLAKITDQADAFYGFYGTNIRVWSDAYARKPGGMLGSAAAVGNLTVSADFGNASETNSFTFRIFCFYTDGTNGYNGNIRINNNQDTRREYRDSVAGKICNGFNISCSSGTGNTDGRIKDIMVSLDGSTVYVEPQSIDYNIPFPAEAGTVYGGTLTLNSDGSGELVVDRECIDMGGRTWAYYASDNYFYAILPGRFTNAQSEGKIGLCSAYKFHGTVASSSVRNMPDKCFMFTSNAGQKYVYIKDSAYTAASDFSAWISGKQIMYPLAEPRTYTLTPAEIRTLLGANNIWADAGPVSVEYTADTKMYIDSQTRATRSLISGIETDLTASRAYAAGDLLIVGDTLYKAAASIASGATLTPGTNVTPTTVAEQLILLANA